MGPYTENRSNNRLINNIISSSIYQILVLIVPIVTTPYVTRIFSVSQMGDYSLSLAMASFFVVISQFGIETYGTREIAKNNTGKDHNKVFFHLLSIQFCISIMMFLLYNIIFLIILDIPEKTLYFYQSLLILINIFDISWFFIGIEEIKRTIFRNTLSKIFITLSIFLIIKNNQQLNLYALINAFGMLLGNLTMIFSSRHYINYRQKKLSLSLKHMKGAFILLIPRMLNSSYPSIENAILKISTTSSNVGVYNQSIKINNILSAVINSGINALSPRMSYHAARNETNEINKIFNKSLKFSAIFSIIFVSGIYAVSDYFVDFFFGPGYGLVSPVLKIVSQSLILIPISVLINRGILIPYSMDREYINSIIIILISGTISNIILDPVLGSYGAGISYNITQILSLLYLLIVTRKIINVADIFKLLMYQIIYISLNIYLVKIIKMYIHFNNSVLSFIVMGIISIMINLTLLLFQYLSKRYYMKPDSE